MRIQPITTFAPLGLLLLTAPACQSNEPANDPADHTATSDSNSLGDFVLTIDASGNADLTVFGSSTRGLYNTYPQGFDGNPNTNPPGTLQAITTAADLPGVNGCPANTNCFTVEIRNFVGIDLYGVYMAIDSIVPAAGRALIAPDPVPAGVTAAGGGRNFGDLVIGAASTRSLNFSIPNTGYYVVNGHFAADDGVRFCTLGYNAPTNVGCQSYGGPLGMDFDVASAIIVTHLGVFDHLGDGLTTQIDAVIWNRANRTQATPVIAFTPGDAGVLENGHRYKALAVPLTLPAGFQGTIAVDGYNTVERNGNASCQAVDWSVDTGGGLVNYVGVSRFGAVNNNINQFPANLATGLVNRYKAGAFAFTAAPGACMLP